MSGNFAQQIANLQRVSRFLSIHGITHWIDFGTLLGAVREGGLIRGDLDLDFDYFEKDRNALLALRDLLAKETNMLLVPGKSILRCCPIHDRLDLTTEFTAIESCTAQGLLYVDFYSCRIQGTTVVHSLNPYSFKRHFIDELEKIEFAGLLFPCPRHRIELCQNRYGPWWQTPISQKIYRNNEFNYIQPLKSESVALLLINGISNHQPPLLLSRAQEIFDRVILGLWNQSNEGSFHSMESNGTKNERMQMPEGPLTMNFMEANGLDYVVGARRDELALRSMARELAENDRLHLLSDNRCQNWL